jgi:hypothetical protein
VAPKAGLVVTEGIEGYLIGAGQTTSSTTVKFLRDENKVMRLIARRCRTARHWVLSKSNVNNFDVTLMERFVNRSGRVSRLNRIEMAHTQHCAVRAVRNIPNLTRVDVSHVIGKAPFSTWRLFFRPSLIRLDLGFTGVEGQLVSKLTDPVPNLEHLGLSGLCHFGGRVLGEWVFLRPSLHSLDLSEAELSVSVLNKLLDRVGSQLETLLFRRAREWRNNFVPSIAERCPRLRHLDLEGGQYPHDKGDLLALLKSCRLTNCRYLYLCAG